MTLTKAEVCELLHISATTLWRRIKAGRYKCTRTGEGQYAALSFTYADIGLQEPQPAPQTIIAVTPEPKPNAVPKTQPKDNRTFAEKFRDGDASDSAGNFIDGANDLYPTTGATLLGPVRQIESGPPLDSQAHMSKAMLGTHDATGAPIEAATAPSDGYTRSGSPLAPGLSQESYNEMMKGWRRSGGGRSESEMEMQIRRAKQNILGSFPR